MIYLNGMSKMNNIQIRDCYFRQSLLFQGGLHMKKISEQVVDFNADIESANTIKDLDFIYNKIIFSNVDNSTVIIFKHLINVKVENLMLKDLASQWLVLNALGM